MPTLVSKVDDIFLPWPAINSLRKRQNCRHSPDIFKCIFLIENVLIFSFKISLKFVPKVQINNTPALVQMMATSHHLSQWWLD